jgi:hypothetical protein
MSNGEYRSGQPCVADDDPCIQLQLLYTDAKDKELKTRIY